MIYLLVIDLYGCFNGIPPEIPEIPESSLICYLRFYIGTCRKPDIERCPRGGILGKLKVLVSTGVTGFDGGSFVESI